jgi:hypothetical protein
MNRPAITSFVLMAALVASATFTAPSAAAPRVPQVPVLGGTLQAYLTGVGESINPSTQQEDIQVWAHTTSATTGFTIMIENTANANLNSISMYNASAPGAPPLYLLLPGALTADAFATGTFLPGNQLRVNRFDSNGIPVSAQTYNGVDPTGFSFAIQGPNGTFYSEDARNPGGKAQALAFAGTGANYGTWWLCFEESSVAAGSDQDFDDAVILMESVNPTPVSRTTWGQLKTRFL